MKKTLVFCSDILPLEGMATSGGGLRSWQIVQGLRGENIDVVYSMPGESYLSRQFRDRMPQGDRKRLWTPTNQEKIIEDERPDAIILTKPALKFWNKDYDIPVAVDFHGPDIMEAEQIMKDSQPMLRYHRAKSKLKTITEADFFTCAGRRQRYYFMAFLLMAGVALEDLQVHFMPMAMPDELPSREPDIKNPSVIFAGGFYPWLDPMPGLLDLAQCLTELKRYSLHIFGGSHETNPAEKKRFDLF